MSAGLRNFLRRLRHRRHFPLLLPHFQVEPTGLHPLFGPVRQLDEKVLEALRACDGRQTAAKVAGAAGIGMGQLVQQHDEEALLFWPRPVPPSLPPAPNRIGAIILSPHPDDAAISLGGMMLAGGPGKVMVVDVFSRTAAWRFPDSLANLARIDAIRRREEALMSLLTGAQVRMLDLPEALLRGRTLDEAFTCAAGTGEAAAGRALAAAAGELAGQYPHARWYLPLGIGNHIDHRVVRDAAVEALRRAGVADRRVSFYEDLPYAAELDWKDRLGTLAGGKLTSVDLPMGRHARWKLELLRLYWSQIAWPQIAEVGRYARRIGRGLAVERVWRREGEI